jgi:hypothetical protein
MIDRLNKIFSYLEQLPVETQEVVATYIEVLVETLERDAIAHGQQKAVDHPRRRGHGQSTLPT